MSLGECESMKLRNNVGKSKVLKFSVNRRLGTSESETGIGGAREGERIQIPRIHGVNGWRNGGRTETDCRRRRENHGRSSCLVRNRGMTLDAKIGMVESMLYIQYCIYQSRVR